MTKTELKALVATWGYNIATADADQMVDHAIRRVMHAHPWDWTRTSMGVDLASGVNTATVTTPIRYLRVAVREGTAAVGTTNLWYDLEYITPDEFFTYINPQGTLTDTALRGAPKYWTDADNGGNIRIYPVPDTAYRLAVEYHKEPDITAAEIPAPVITDDLVPWALVSQYAVRERDWQMHNVAETQYQQRLRAAVGEQNLKQQQNPTRVTQSNWYENF